LTGSLTDVFIQGEAGEIIERLLSVLKKDFPVSKSQSTQNEDSGLGF
jgi:hypothetical protein